MTQIDGLLNIFKDLGPRAAVAHLLCLCGYPSMRIVAMDRGSQVACILLLKLLFGHEWRGLEKYLRRTPPGFGLRHPGGKGMTSGLREDF